LCIGRATNGILRAKVAILLPTTDKGRVFGRECSPRGGLCARRRSAVCNQKNAVGRKIHTVEGKYTSSTLKSIPDFEDGSKSRARGRKKTDNPIDSQFQAM
jgi:hypothetical protein